MTETLMTEGGETGAGEIAVVENPIQQQYGEQLAAKKWSGDATKDAVYESYFALEKSMGDKVKIPTAESSAEDISSFYQKIGCPEKPDGYEILRPELPEGMEYDEQFETDIRGIAKDIGITQSQMGRLFAAYNDYQINGFNAQTAEITAGFQAGQKALHEEWGGEYDANVQIAQQACKELGSDEFAEMLVTTGIGNNAVFVKTFCGIGKKIINDSFVSGSLATKEVDGYVPASPNSPQQYTNMDGENGAKARAYFRAKGHIYDRAD